jgi:hypothetical protein
MAEGKMNKFCTIQPWITMDACTQTSMENIEQGRTDFLAHGPDSKDKKLCEPHIKSFTLFLI